MRHIELWTTAVCFWKYALRLSRDACRNATTAAKGLLAALQRPRMFCFFAVVVIGLNAWLMPSHANNAFDWLNHTVLFVIAGAACSRLLLEIQRQLKQSIYRIGLYWAAVYLIIVFGGIEQSRFITIGNAFYTSISRADTHWFLDSVAELTPNNAFIRHAEAAATNVDEPALEDALQEAQSLPMSGMSTLERSRSVSAIANCYAATTKLCALPASRKSVRGSHEIALADKWYTLVDPLKLSGDEQIAYSVANTGLFTDLATIASRSCSREDILNALAHFRSGDFSTLSLKSQTRAWLLKARLDNLASGTDQAHRDLSIAEQTISISPSISGGEALLAEVALQRMQLLVGDIDGLPSQDQRRQMEDFDKQIAAWGCSNNWIGIAGNSELARFYLAFGPFEKAQQTLNRCKTYVLCDVPKSVIAFGRLVQGEIYIGEGLPRHARDELNAAQAILDNEFGLRNAWDANLVADLAILDFRDGNFIASSNALNELLKNPNLSQVMSKPDIIQLHLNLSDTYCEQGKFTDAANTITAVVAPGGSNSFGAVRLGVIKVEVDLRNQLTSQAQLKIDVDYLRDTAVPYLRNQDIKLCDLLPKALEALSTANLLIGENREGLNAALDELKSYQSLLNSNGAPNLFWPYILCIRSSINLDALDDADKYLISALDVATTLDQQAMVKMFQSTVDLRRSALAESLKSKEKFARMAIAHCAVAFEMLKNSVSTTMNDQVTAMLIANSAAAKTVLFSNKTER